MTDVAQAQLTGFNHIVVYVHDMTEAIRFYRDVLGLQVIKSLPRFTTEAKSQIEDAEGYEIAMYFLEVANGNAIGLVEYPAAPPSPSVFDHGGEGFPSWPGERPATSDPQKVDYLSFGVPTHDDLVWFHQHLRDQGVDVSEITETTHPTSPFTESIYFYDPFGNPLAIKNTQHR